MKAITPVIALVVLMLITVGIVGISYTWFSGLFSSQTKKAISIPPGGALCSNGEIKAFVLNNGDSAITTSDILVAQVDGVDVLNTPFFGDLSTGLVGWWKFDDGSGSTARDSSGNNINGALFNTPEWINGKSQKALRFVTSDSDYVKVDYTPSFTGMDSIVLEAWVRFSSDPTGTIQEVAQKWTGWTFGYNSIGWWFELYASDGSGYVTAINDAWAPQPGRWYHVTSFYNKIATGTFIDGKLIQLHSEAVDNKIIANTAGDNLGIGAAGFPGGVSGRYFNGDIDELKIYKTAAGNFNIQPGRSGMVINYPGTDGKHSLKIATSSSTAEATVNC